MCSLDIVLELLSHDNLKKDNDFVIRNGWSYQDRFDVPFSPGSRWSDRSRPSNGDLRTSFKLDDLFFNHYIWNFEKTGTIDWLRSKASRNLKTTLEAIPNYSLHVFGNAKNSTSHFCITHSNMMYVRFCFKTSIFCHKKVTSEVISLVYKEINSFDLEFFSEMSLEYLFSRCLCLFNSQKRWS